MEKIKMLPTFVMAIIFLVTIAGCSKIQLGNGSGNNDPSGGYNFHAFWVKVVKLHNYPVSSHLLIERHVHPTYDSSVTYQHTLLSRDLPFNDTTLFCVDTLFYNHYLTWKVTGINGDSLSSGRTSLKHMSENTNPTNPIQIYY